jgi:hypothetical protein
MTNQRLIATMQNSSKMACGNSNHLSRRRQKDKTMSYIHTVFNGWSLLTNR